MTLRPEAMLRAFPNQPVPGWLRRFATEPLAALSELLAGHADLGHLQAGDGVVLLRTWMECVSDQSFTAEVDWALSEWIGRFWGDPAPTFAAGSPAVTAEAWIAAGDLIWSAGTLPSAARRLQELLPERAHFLRSLSEGLSRDPEASAWLAVANYQTDRSLLNHWWSFVSLQSTVPWYHGRLGIEGLRRLPQTPERRGRTPRELQEGLFRLGEALALRVDEGWLSEGDGRGEFLRAVHDLTRAYPSGRWMRFFRDTAARARVERYREWLGGVGLTERDLSNRQSSVYVMTRDWANRIGPISAGLLAGSANAAKQANQLLQEQLEHASVTGDAWGYERSVGRFAHAAASRLPNDALRWLDQGLEIAPSNAHLWSLKVNVLRRSSGAEALACAREAMRRFPADDVIRNSLGQALLTMKRYEEAEQVFRETMRRSPDNEFARNSLGQVLLAMSRYEEAEQVFREALRRFPNNYVMRNSLGQALLAMKRREEAEQVFRETMRRSPDDAVARKGLEKTQRKSPKEDPRIADVESVAISDDGPVNVDLDRVPLETNRSYESQGLAPESTKEPPSNVGGEAPAEPIPESISVRPAAISKPSQGESVEVSPPGAVLSWRQQDLDVLLTDAFFQRMWARTRGVNLSPGATSGLKEMTQRLFQATTDPTAAGEYGLLEIDRNQVEEAREFLRLAARRFPGSGRIRYALARAEREWAAARQLRLDEDQSADVLRSWDRLPLVDARLTPVVHLGKARAWLALRDGRRVEDGAAESFSRLAAFLRPYLASTKKDFVSNWARDTHRFVFTAENVAAKIDRMRASVTEDAALLNEQEEIYVKAVCP